MHPLSSARKRTLEYIAKIKKRKKERSRWGKERMALAEMIMSIQTWIFERRSEIKRMTHESSTQQSSEHYREGNIWPHRSWPLHGALQWSSRLSELADINRTRNHMHKVQNLIPWNADPSPSENSQITQQTGQLSILEWITKSKHTVSLQTLKGNYKNLILFRLKISLTQGLDM